MLIIITFMPSPVTTRKSTSLLLTGAGQIIEQPESGIIKLQACGGTFLFFKEPEVERIGGRNAPAP